MLLLLLTHPPTHPPSFFLPTVKEERQIERVRPSFSYSTTHPPTHSYAKGASLRWSASAISFHLEEVNFFFTAFSSRRDWVCRE